MRRGGISDRHEEREPRNDKRDAGGCLPATMTVRSAARQFRHSFTENEREDIEKDELQPCKRVDDRDTAERDGKTREDARDASNYLIGKDEKLRAIARTCSTMEYGLSECRDDEERERERHVHHSRPEEAIEEGHCKDDKLEGKRRRAEEETSEKREKHRAASEVEMRDERRPCRQHENGRYETSRNVTFDENSGKYERSDSRHGSDDRRNVGRAREPERRIEEIDTGNEHRGVHEREHDNMRAGHVHHAERQKHDDESGEERDKERIDDRLADVPRFDDDMSVYKRRDRKKELRKNSKREPRIHLIILLYGNARPRDCQHLMKNAQEPAPLLRRHQPLPYRHL